MQRVHQREVNRLAQQAREIELERMKRGVLKAESMEAHLDANGEIIGVKVGNQKYLKPFLKPTAKCQHTEKTYGANKFMSWTKCKKCKASAEMQNVLAQTSTAAEEPARAAGAASSGEDVSNISASSSMMNQEANQNLTPTLRTPSTPSLSYTSNNVDAVFSVSH